MAVQTQDDGAAISTAIVWDDAAFKRRLLSEPKPALRELGIAVPDDVSVRLVTSKGAPGDEDDHSLMQFVLERGDDFAHFFLPSPRSPCAQQAVYGRILTRRLGDPLLDRAIRADAEAALRRLGGTA
ncbi:hypothetical protein GCM10017083_06330 [Thalassobaculum fulvum]|uniref:Uncharacterized protein n=1 Tax=Thalassobaculum fulvum TaxID=1633335 RepID=A0A919CP93_9PROT|nr:hypothetical protein [Thalassobaculum fulvum]GHD41917.1 hypothetical protein GCM10017083_06330 [Thalassobaculum fulvum]